MCDNWVIGFAGICCSRMLFAEDLSVDVGEERNPIEAVITHLEQHSCQDALWNFCDQSLQDCHLKDGQETCKHTSHLCHRSFVQDENRSDGRLRARDAAKQRTEGVAQSLSDQFQVLVC